MPERVKASPFSHEAAVEQPALSGLTIAIFAVACGLAVGNLYYAQPLLETIGAAFGVSEAGASLIVTVTQLGYAAGLVLIAPLGDLFENRRLIATVLCGTVVALAAAALAPSFGAFIAASLGIAAHLAPAKRRGRVVGQVMSGLLTGILLARAAAGGSRARSAGALFAPLAGRLGDSGHERIVTGGAFLAAAAAFALTLLQKQMWALVCGAIVLDLAVQTTLVLGQRAIGSTCWGRTPVGDRRALRRFLAGTVFFRDSPYRFCCAT